MSNRPWIAFYMGDYLKDTMHLTTEQHGAYLLLLMECWTQGRIPTDLQGQAVIVRMSVYRWKKSALRCSSTSKRTAQIFELARR